MIELVSFYKEMLNNFAKLFSIFAHIKVHYYEPSAIKRIEMGSKNALQKRIVALYTMVELIYY